MVPGWNGFPFGRLHSRVYACFSRPRCWPREGAGTCSSPWPAASLGIRTRQYAITLHETNDPVTTKEGTGSDACTVLLPTAYTYASRRCKWGARGVCTGFEGGAWSERMRCAVFPASLTAEAQLKNKFNLGPHQGVMLRRLWPTVRWENTHKEALWRLAVDGIPLLGNSHMRGGPG